MPAHGLARHAERSTNPGHRIARSSRLPDGIRALSRPQPGLLVAKRPMHAARHCIGQCCGAWSREHLIRRRRVLLGVDRLPCALSSRVDPARATGGRVGLATSR
jgi:hypothetical protein